MKLVTIKFVDSMDIASLPLGSEGVNVTVGNTELQGGTLVAKIELAESDPVLVPHTHPVGDTGPAAPAPQGGGEEPSGDG